MAVIEALVARDAYERWKLDQRGTPPHNEECEVDSSTIENEIQTKGLTAQRVTPQDVENEIAAEYTFTADAALQQAPIHPATKLLTFCVLVLRNGFTVTGESACASPENFDADIGRKIARQNAVAKVWPLLGFRLRDTLSDVPTLAAG